jgi:hypothetical protein
MEDMRPTKIRRITDVEATPIYPFSGDDYADSVLIQRALEELAEEGWFGSCRYEYYSQAATELYKRMMCADLYTVTGDVMIDLASAQRCLATSMRISDDSARMYWENYRARARHLIAGYYEELMVVTNPISHEVVEENGLLEALGGMQRAVSKAQDDISTVSEFLSVVREFTERIDTIVRQGDKDTSFVEALISRLESLLVLIYDLSTRETLGDMVAPSIQYLKTWFPNQSIFKRVVDMVTAVLNVGSDGEPIGHLRAEKGFFSENFQQLTEGPFGERFAGLLNLLIMTSVLGEQAPNHLTAEMYKIFHVTAIRKKHPSIFHHLFMTLDWCVDSVIPAITTGDMSLLLYDSDFGELDELYRNSINMVALSIGGNMAEAEKKHGITEDAEIIVYITKTIAAHSVLQKRTTDKGLKKEILTRLLRLDKLMNDIQAFWHESGLREAPYAVLIRGPSSVGKSILANIVVHAISKANKFAEGKEYSVTLNAMDPYLSEFRAQHIAVIFDDIGNTRPERCTENPLFILIQFINNMHCTAMSPIAEEKGKKQIRSKIVVATTNSNDLGASFWSINPTSILRRFKLILDVELKDEAKGPDGSISSKYAGVSHPDAWKITPLYVKIRRNTVERLLDSHVFLHVEDRKEWDIVDLVEYLTRVTPEHFNIQKKIVQSSTDVHLKEHCEAHPAFTVPCPKCAKEGGFVPIISDNKKVSEEDGYYFGGKSKQLSWLDGFAAQAPVQIHDALDRSEEGDETRSPQERIAYYVGLKHAQLRDIAKVSKSIIKKHPLQVGLAVVATIGLTGVAMNNFLKIQKVDEEGAVIARIEEAAKIPRNLVKRDGKYQKFYSNVEHIAYPEAAVTGTLEHLESRIDRNLKMMTVTPLDKHSLQPVAPTTWGNTFPVGGDRWATTNHYFLDAEDFTVTQKVRPELGDRTDLIDSSNIEKVDGLDLAHFSYAAGSSFDFRKYMFKDMKAWKLSKNDDLFIYHAHKDCADGEKTYVPPSAYKLVTKVKDIGDFELTQQGITQKCFSYNTKTHPGFCGSLVVAAGRNPTIVGVHVAGDVSSGYGVAIPVTADMFTPKKTKMVIKEEAPFVTHMMDKSFSITRDVHMFNPIHWLPEDDTFDLNILGQHDVPLSKFSSDVIESPLLKGMVEKLGYEPTHGAPKRRGARPSRRRHLIETTRRMPPARPRYIAAAFEDFKRKLAPLIHSDRFAEHVHTVTYKEAVNGVSGEHGFDPINPKTSLGWPMNCPKFKAFLKHDFNIDTFKFVTVTEVDGVKQYEFEIVFDKDVIDMENNVETLAQQFLDGYRANTVWRTNLKDEGLTWKKIDNDRIRIIAGAQTPFVILTRMLTMPLLNIMSCFPKEFESAVGIDATGKEWQYLWDYISEYGEDRMGDGDFSEFDMHTDSKFTSKAFELIRWIFEECDWPEDLLSIWDGIATECIFPWYENDGLLYQALRSNPSGHPLTVIINGFVNSLYLRYAYYAMHECDTVGDIPLFHERVNLATFGDDNTFNVHPSEELFGMNTIGEQLAKIGVAYTDSTKQVTHERFKGDITFLKRGFRYHEALGARVGNLDLKSIWKSLALTRRPKKGQKETTANIMGSCLHAACIELYYHGEEVFDKYVPILLEIADVKDELGDRVLDYFQVPTKEDIVEKFNQTTCKYVEAARIVYEQAGFYRPSIRGDEPELNDLQFVDSSQYTPEFHQLILDQPLLQRVVLKQRIADQYAQLDEFSERRTVGNFERWVRDRGNYIWQRIEDDATQIGFIYFLWFKFGDKVHIREDGYWRLLLTSKSEWLWIRPYRWLRHYFGLIEIPIFPVMVAVAVRRNRFWKARYIANLISIYHGDVVNDRLPMMETLRDYRAIKIMNRLHIKSTPKMVDVPGSVDIHKRILSFLALDDSLKDITAINRVQAISFPGRPDVVNVYAVLFAHKNKSHVEAWERFDNIVIDGILQIVGGHIWQSINGVFKRVPEYNFIPPRVLENPPRDWLL